MTNYRFLNLITDRAAKRLAKVELITGWEGRFSGESYGWEAQYLEGGELLFSHGLFLTRAAAVQWAEQMRPTVERGDA